MRKIWLSVALLGVSAAVFTQPLLAQRSAEEWEIGPIIRGKNYSVGMPLHPIQTRRGWSFDIPYPNAAAGHAHYVTFDAGTLAGKSGIVLRYRIDAAPDARLIAHEAPDLPATLSLFFQRRGDNWRGTGVYETFRWYSDQTFPLTVGEHVATVRFDSQWRGVLDSKSHTSPDLFAEAMRNAERVGFVLGSEAGRGHGVYATQPATFTILSFEILD